MSDKKIYTCYTTFNCAFQKNCISCQYKLFPEGIIPMELLPKGQSKGYELPCNVRPETCPRFKLNHYDGIYSSNQNILTVGDGDLSFSLSIANHFAKDNSAHKLFATTHESYNSIVQTYKDGESNIQDLKKVGVSVYHQVDATNLAATRELDGHQFDIVIWNFPCVRIDKGADGQVSELDQNKLLVSDFLANIQPYLKEGGELHISHKTIEPFSWWDIASIAEQNNLKHQLSIVFDRCNYPGYINRKVLDKKSFPCHDARIFVFTNLDIKKKEIKKKYSEKIIKLNESEVLQIIEAHISNPSPKVITQAEKEKELYASKPNTKRFYQEKQTINQTKSHSLPLPINKKQRFFD